MSAAAAADRALARLFARRRGTCEDTLLAGCLGKARQVDEADGSDDGAATPSLAAQDASELLLASVFARRRGICGSARRALLSRALMARPWRHQRAELVDSEEDYYSDVEASPGEEEEGDLDPGTCSPRRSTPSAAVREQERSSPLRRRALSVQIRLPEATTAAIVSSGGGTPLGLQLRAVTSPSASSQGASPRLLVRLPDVGKSWQISLPFSVDPEDASTVAKLNRRNSTLTIDNLLEVGKRTSEDCASGVADMQSSLHEETAKQEVEDNEDEEQICRYCFSGSEDGPLISPCRCTGGQKYVHLSCLRRWQRLVVVSQPTHPAFWEDDCRHQKCNVCLADFTCPPPTRQELMESFTGPELAALLEEGCIIGASEIFTKELESRMEAMSTFTRQISSYAHWIRGVYLITEVSEEKAEPLTVLLSSESSLEAFRSRFSSSSLSVQTRGQRHKLIAGGSLAGVAKEALAECLASLTAPATLILAPEMEAECGTDHITAVNFCRPIAEPSPRQKAQVDAARDTLAPEAAEVQVSHFNGGPCDSDAISCCIVLGTRGRGWAVWHSLLGALRLAGRNFSEPRAGAGHLLVFWGSAAWSRAQLLGEIARGHWGLCRASSADLSLHADPVQLRQGLEGRLAFAPVTEMTEDFVREAHREMAAVREEARSVLLAAQEDED